MASRFASETSEEMIQINFLWYIVSHWADPGFLLGGGAHLRNDVTDR